MNKRYRIFDGWAERFEKRIYADDNPKGLIRKTILERDLREVLLDDAVGRINIWFISATRLLTNNHTRKPYEFYSRNNRIAAVPANWRNSDSPVRIKNPWSRAWHVITANHVTINS